MATYRYRAQDVSGKIVKGTREAHDELELHHLLKDEGLALIDAVSVGGDCRSRKPLKQRALSSFCLKLSELLNAGVPLVRSLTIVAEEEGNKPAETEVFQGLIETVKTGAQLSQAMELSCGAFPPLLVNMVKSAEESGDLASVLKRMSVHYDKEYRLAAKVRSSTTYPKILAALLVVVVGILAGFVLPQFEELFSNMESLPLPTTILLATTGFISAHWLLLLVVLIAVIALWKVALMLDAVRVAADRIKLKLPVLGKLNATVCTARFARTFASLYNSGIGIITALQVGAGTVGNAYIESQFDKAISAVSGGNALSDSLARIDGFNRKFISSVRVGEESGSLESMLESTASTMEFESEDAMQRMVGYLEPCMIILMALLVGFVVVAVIVPIYQSYSTIGA